MQLANSSDDDSWGCDYCGKSNSQRGIGEKVAAWRCTANFRNSKEKTMRNGCDYDICSNCIKQYRVSFSAQLSHNITTCRKSLSILSRSSSIYQRKKSKIIIIIILSFHQYVLYFQGILLHQKGLGWC